MRLDFGLAALLAAVTCFATRVEGATDEALEHARELLASTPLIDGHNDLPWTIRTDPDTPKDVSAYDLRERTAGDTDLPKLREGRVGGQFWSVWIPGENREEGYAKVQLEQIDIALRMIERYPDDLALALTASDIESAFANGRIASLLGMEGGYGLENSLGLLRIYHRLGVRYMTLVHNVTLDWVDAALDRPRHNGLTAFGRAVVHEMNRLGMLVDLSHTTPEVMMDALELSLAPVIFSHAGARAVTDHPRNVPDAVLERLAANDGVIMVCFVPAFVSQEVADWEAPLLQRLKAITTADEHDRIRREYAEEHPMPRATLAHVADHIAHVRDTVGVEHVGIGSDFWGGGDMPIGLENTSRFPYLFAELVRRGWSDEELRKLAGQNILRVMKKAEQVAVRLQETSTRPSTVTIGTEGGTDRR